MNDSAFAAKLRTEGGKKKKKKEKSVKVQLYRIVYKFIFEYLSESYN